MLCARMGVCVCVDWLVVLVGFGLVIEGRAAQ